MQDNTIDCCLDFETYWDDGYSLSKMSTVEYITDPRFEVQVCSFYIPFLRNSIIKTSGEYTTIVFKTLKALQRNGKRIRLIGHNLSFDGMICKLVYNFEPDTYFDTSTMCWYSCGNTLKNAKLETLAAHFDLRPPASMIHKVCGLLGLPYNADERKLSAALRATKGLRLAEMPKNLLAALAEYCAADVWLTWALYQKLNVAPPMLLAVQDQRLQALIRLPLEIDVTLLEELRTQYSEDREDAVVAFGASYYDTYGVQLDVLKTIRSKIKFKELLLNLGVPESAIPMKPNKKGDGFTEAFAKNDMALSLLVEEYPDIHLLAEAVDLRLNYNSSMVESKFNSFIKAGRVGKWGFHVKPLSAPNTIRHAGGSATGSSPQNLKRATKPTYNADGIPTKTLAKLGLRDAIMSPPGRELVVADLSGIELRTAMWFARDEPAIAALSDPTRDMYTEDGRVYFDCPDMTKADKELRNAAKVVDLSCIAINTEVLTACGWKPIQHVTNLDLVWDGIEFVECAGAHYMGDKPVVSLNGVYLTRDHEVLDNDQWVEAGSASAKTTAECAKRHLPNREYDHTGRVCRSDHAFSRTGSPACKRPARREGEESPPTSGMDEVWGGSIHVSPCDQVHRESNAARGICTSPSIEDTPHVQHGGFYGRSYQSRAKRGCAAGAFSRGGSQHSKATARVQAILNDKSGGRVASPRKCAHTESPCGSAWERRAREETLRPATRSFRHTRVQGKKGQEFHPYVGAAYRAGASRHCREVTQTCSKYNYRGAMGEHQCMCGKSRSGGMQRVVCGIGALQNVSGSYTGVRNPTTPVPVYDVLNCGARARYMVRAPGSSTPMIVHNCQYLVGWRKILHQARVMRVAMTAEMAQAAHKKYRVMHPAVVRLWNRLLRWLQDSTSRRPFEEELYPVILRNKEIVMPSGFILRYPDLRYDPATRGYTYWSANRKCRINVHAGMLVENISQHLAGHVFNGHQLKVAERLASLGGIFVGDVHDEMLFTVPDGAGELALKIMLETMSEPTPWWPELVTFAEGDHGYSLVESPDPSLARRSRYGCLK